MAQNTRVNLIDAATEHLNGEVQVRMVLNTLRELTGHALEIKASSQGKNFDWKKFKVLFERQYGKLDLDELMAEAAKFGFTSVEEVRAERQKQLATFYKRQNAYKAAVARNDELAELTA
ncbi:hypothetical protein ACKFKG_30215 [Phormidesmis sp. 146-35]